MKLEEHLEKIHNAAVVINSSYKEIKSQLIGEQLEIALGAITVACKFIYASIEGQKLR